MLTRSLRPLLILAFTGLLASPALAVSIFFEDFNGYTSFPTTNPNGDFVNTGLPKPAEGSDQTWYGARFEDSGSTASSINDDLFVQKCGDFTGFNCQSASGSGNKTPVGRFEDDAGIMLQISTVGYSDVTLNFDWRTFLAETTDRYRVGYIVTSSAIPLMTLAGEGGFADLRTGPYAWSNWTQLMSSTASSPFQASPTFNLPSGAAYLYVAFWMDDGEGDNGKLDNVHIQGTLVPEPSALLLLAPLAWLAVRRTA